MANMTPTDYDSAARILAGGRNKDQRKIANNTWLEHIGDAYAVRLHGTDVVRFYKDGTVVFSTGGWHTRTTADRLNAYAPGGIRFMIRKGEMLAVLGRDYDNPIPFHDSMRYDPRRGRLV